MNLELRDKRALVLGGSSGIGEAIANSFLQEGMKVIVASRTPPQNNALLHVGADLSDPSSPQKVYQETKNALDGVDVVVLNGGGPPPGSALETEIKQYHGWINAMVFNQIQLCQLFVKDMIEQNFGRILAISSTSIKAPIGSLVLSNTMRASLNAWCKTLSNEVAKHCVTVNTLMPGRISTPRLKALHAARAQRRGVDIETVTSEAVRDIPLDRFGSVEEFAAVATFLASPLSSYVTGASIPIDGGLLQT